VPTHDPDPATPPAIPPSPSQPPGGPSQPRSFGDSQVRPEFPATAARCPDVAPDPAPTTHSPVGHSPVGHSAGGDLPASPPPQSAREWLGRVGVRLWALPNTLLGLMWLPLALASGGGVQWVWGVCEIHGGVVGWLLRKAIPLPGGARALTLGHVILGRDRQALALCREHEHVHVRQYERYGPLFLPLYLGWSLWLALRGRRAYLDNPFEREAYRD